MSSGYLSSRSLRGIRAVVAASPLIVLAGVLGACKGSDQAEAAAGPETIAVSPENIYVVRSELLQSGPAISGNLTPEQNATIRAEVGGSVVATYVEEGQRVARGTQLAKIDETAIQDSYLSARSALTAAQSAADVAAREEERATALVAAGAIAEREVETARRANVAAQAQLADARARLAIAEKQLQNTVAVAPFDGVVGERQVSVGDVVQPGAPMFTVVDPSTMRLEASVPADQLAMVRPGFPVSFTVTGYPGRAFAGKITRVSPTADPTTGQVRIFASIPNGGQALVAGLFAEGRIAAESHVGPVIPAEALDERATSPAVMRIRNGSVERVAVQIGVRDAATERVEVLAGVAIGDTVLTGAARAISANTPVRVSAPDAPAPDAPVPGSR
jgi:RND family efflux transporter MFP subunit